MFGVSLPKVHRHRHEGGAAVVEEAAVEVAKEQRPPATIATVGHRGGGAAVVAVRNGLPEGGVRGDRLHPRSVCDSADRGRGVLDARGVREDTDLCPPVHRIRQMFSRLLRAAALRPGGGDQEKFSQSHCYPYFDHLGR